jgi:hypothetical protein
VNRLTLKFDNGVCIEVPDGSLVTITPPADKVVRPRRMVPPGTTVEDVLDNSWRKKLKEKGT